MRPFIRRNNLNFIIKLTYIFMLTGFLTGTFVGVFAGIEADIDAKAHGEVNKHFLVVENAFAGMLFGTGIPLLAGIICSLFKIMLCPQRSPSAPIQITIQSGTFQHTDTPQQANDDDAINMPEQAGDIGLTNN